MFLARESTPRKKKFSKIPTVRKIDVPSYTVDFWDFAWFEDGI